MTANSGGGGAGALSAVPVGSAFDRALEARIVKLAAEEYAARRGTPGSSAYRTAWLRFREQVHTIEDLEAWRLRSVRHRRAVKILGSMMARAQLIDRTPLATAQLLDDRTGALRLVATAGFAREFCEFFKVVEGASCACGSALANREPVWVRDVRRSDVFAGTEALDVMLRAESAACASVPVTAPDGRIVAMVSTHHSSPAAWDVERKRELRRLARSTGALLQAVSAPVPVRAGRILNGEGAIPENPVSRIER